MVSDDALEAFARAKGGTAFHPSCTVRMGPTGSAPLGAESRLRGIRSLRLIGAQARPMMTSANTNAPTLLVAGRGAALLRREAPLPAVSI